MDTISKIIHFGIYCFDCSTDVYCAVQHYKHGDYNWGGFTVLFIVLPMVLVSVFVALNDGQNSKIYREVAYEALPWILTFPVMPISILVRRIVDGIVLRYPDGKEDGELTNWQAMVLLQGVSQSAPQAALNMYIVARKLRVSKDFTKIDDWQYYAIAISLLCVAYTLSIWPKDRSICGKALSFMHVLLFISSRIAVCSVYAMYNSEYNRWWWFVPVGLELGAYWPAKCLTVCHIRMVMCLLCFPKWLKRPIIYLVKVLLNFLILTVNCGVAYYAHSVGVYGVWPLAAEYAFYLAAVSCVCHVIYNAFQFSTTVDFSFMDYETV